MISYLTWMISYLFSTLNYSRCMCERKKKKKQQIFSTRFQKAKFQDGIPFLRTSIKSSVLRWQYSVFALCKSYEKSDLSSTLSERFLYFFFLYYYFYFFFTSLILLSSTASLIMVFAMMSSSSRDVHWCP